MRCPVAEAKKRWVRGGMCTVMGLGGMTTKGHLVGGGLEEVRLGCGSTRDKLRERKE